MKRDGLSPLSMPWFRRQRRKETNMIRMDGRTKTDKHSERKRWWDKNASSLIRYFSCVHFYFLLLLFIIIPFVGLPTMAMHGICECARFPSFFPHHPSSIVDVFLIHPSDFQLICIRRRWMDEEWGGQVVVAVERWMWCWLWLFLDKNRKNGSVTRSFRWPSGMVECVFRERNDEK